MVDESGPVNRDPRRGLPSVDRLAREIQRASGPELPEWAAIEAARAAVAAARQSVEALPPGEIPQPIEFAQMLDDAVGRARQLAAPHPQRVINATGIVLHTNLGRAPMAPGAAAAAAGAASGYSDLELDLITGRRGERLGAVALKLSRLGGADAAYACNNCAAAVLLALNSLAAGREVIVSRGELVEIGGSFRVPEIMERAGVRLVEVGSTNRTHLRDYESAVGPETALLLKVHRSNFAQTGFVKEVSLAELAELGRARGIPVMEDLGSGTLVDLSAHGFPAEAHAPARLAQGADLVCFSGDKLMGGPQAGLVLGRHDLVSALKANPLARALRLDAMTLAALDWTLDAMLAGRAESDLPLLAQILTPLTVLEARARSLEMAIETGLGSLGSKPPRTTIRKDRAPVGGGTLPEFELATAVLEIRTDTSADRVAERLRLGSPPVLVRIREGALVVDPRSVFETEMKELEHALVSALR